MSTLLLMLILLAAIYFCYIAPRKKAEMEAEEQRKQQEKERKERELVEALKKTEEKKKFEEMCSKVKNADVYIDIKNKINSAIISHLDEIKDAYVTENNDDLIAIRINDDCIDVYSYSGRKGSPTYFVAYDESKEEYEASDYITGFNYDEAGLKKIFEFSYNEMGISNFDVEMIKAFYSIFSTDLSNLFLERGISIKYFEYTVWFDSWAKLGPNCEFLVINFNKCYKQVKPLF